MKIAAKNIQFNFLFDVSCSLLCSEAFNIALNFGRPFLKEMQQLPLRIDVGVKNTSLKLVEAFVDSVFEFVVQPLLPSQSNFAPVDELKEGVQASSNSWVEGEGMLHALYFCRGLDQSWTVVYKNRHVKTDTFELEKQRNKPSFLPALEGDSTAVLSAYLFNMKTPGSGELVIMGIDATKPYAEMGVISEGKKLLHKADLKLDKCILFHEIGVTHRYNIFMDHPLSLDLKRLVDGGPLIKYIKEGDAMIGIMLRYGDADSFQWFKVKPNCTFHLFNCFEDGDEVVIWGCRALESVIPGPEKGKNKFDWFSRKFRPLNSTGGSINDAVSEDQLVFPRPYEWRLNMKTGGVKETNLTGTDFKLDFPFINEAFIGLRNNYGYSQVHDSIASSASVPQFQAWLNMEALQSCILESRAESYLGENQGLIKVEHHVFERNTFCSGAAFVPKDKGVEEDDGCVITFVHNEATNASQVLIIEAKSFTSKPVAKITLPFRVPYGFHGAFRPMQLQNEISTIIPSSNFRYFK
ncbi:Carotenoid 9,10(9',10')-cleavage dioxygenase 1, putative isoform 2 [Hibiscus syriacus]|uniref:Carotenoid 9,10(9',10')-cleavage dioxygenase 1, putative isoform 2 n=1 Tax=Hibiscus syriacus TaxID=106335 RepID=A0A6A3D0J9_HIBSY|nr:Carotenoid 9,10(9',10')-cleavage dioxygenase 1, putative isoform 2 [Hibiscus syriacus]